MDKRIFEVGDWVEYRPFEDCSRNNIQRDGKVLEVLEDNFYLVQFGLRSMHGTRTGKYYWTNLFENEKDYE